MSLVARYAFYSSLTADTTGTYTLTQVGSSTTLVSDATMGYAASFDGTLANGFTTAATNTTSFSGNDERTFSVWINISSSTDTSSRAVWQHGSVASAGNRYRMTVAKDSTLLRLDYYTVFSEITYSDTFEAGTWYHIAVTYNGTLSRVFVNGTSIGTATRTLNTTQSLMSIGYDRANTAFVSFHGLMSDFRIYNGQLTSAQVSTLYTDGANDDLVALAVSYTSSNVSSYGSSDGSIDLTVSGGNGTYTYVWSDGSVTTQDRTSLAAGSYEVTVTSGTNYTTQSVTITEPLSLSYTSTNVSSYGSSTGAIDLTVAGGTGSYSYVWSDGSTTTQDRTSLAAGSYEVTVTSGSYTGTQSVTITQPLSLSYTSTNVSSYGSSDGAIDLTVAGGTGSYTYVWSDGSTTTQDRSSLAAGSYEVTVTSGSYEDTQSVTITQPLSLSYTSTDVSSYGSSDGAIDLTVLGGTGSYSYAWSDGSVTTQDRSSLAAGSYEVTVTSGSYEDTQSITITQPLSLSYTSTNASSYGSSDGSIDLTVLGGIGSYTYAWSDGSVTTQDRSSLAAGSYEVTVTSGSYEDTQSVTITEPLSLSYTSTDVSTYGASTGAIDLTVAGGTGSYSYAWSDGSVTTQDRSSLPAGSYEVTVTSGSYEDTQSVAIIQGIGLSYTSMNPATAGSSTGSIDLTVDGGTGSYSYEWSDGPTTQDRTDLSVGTYSVTVTSGIYSASTSVTLTQSVHLSYVITNVDVYGSSTGSIDVTPSGGDGSYAYSWADGPTSQNRTGLPVGTYEVTVTSDSYTATESFVVTQPLSLSYTSTNVSSYGSSDGAIDLTVAGGTGSYTYAWSDGSVTTQDRSSLAAGSYTVTVTSGSYEDTQSVTITEPLSLSYTSTNASSYGSSDGAIDITVLGGTGSYTYAWSDGPTTQDRSSLAAGSYEVTVTSGSYEDTQSVTITQPLSVSYTSANASSYGSSDGSIDLTVLGGTGSYSYAWSDGSVTTQDRSSLAAGSYEVTVTSGSYEDTQSIAITEPLSLSYTSTDASSYGSSDGAIDLTVAGGTGSYTYAWSDGSITTQDRSSLTAGSYEVTVTSGSYEDTQSVVITEPLSLSYTSTNASSYGSSDGAIDLTVLGGIGSYTYVWSDGPTTQDRTSLSTGSYEVTVTSGSYTGTQEVTITEPLSLSYTSTNVSSYGSSDGAIDLTVVGGTGFYSYAWSDGSTTTQDRTSLSAGSYTVTVTSGSYSSSASVTVTEPLNLTYSAVDVTSYGSSDGYIDVTVSGGTGSYIYSWSDGPSTQDRTSLAAGSYDITVTSDSYTSSETVYVYQPLYITYSTSNASGSSTSDGSIDVTVVGGNESYTYAWSDGPTTQDRSDLSTGTYEVTVYSGSYEETKTISVGYDLSISLEPEDLPYAFEQDVADAKATVSGTWVTRGMYQVGTSVADVDTTLKNSYYVYDATSSTTTEIVRKSFALSADGSAATVGIGALRTDQDAVQTMEAVIQTSAEKTLVNSFSGTATDAEITTATLDGALSWDRDDAALYFGASKKFRIAYSASSGSDPAKLRIQGLNTLTGEYETRAEFETD